MTSEWCRNTAFRRKTSPRRGPISGKACSLASWIRAEMQLENCVVYAAPAPHSRGPRRAGKRRNRWTSRNRGTWSPGTLRQPGVYITTLENSNSIISIPQFWNSQIELSFNSRMNFCTTENFEFEFEFLSVVIYAPGECRRFPGTGPIWRTGCPTGRLCDFGTERSRSASRMAARQIESRRWLLKKNSENRRMVESKCQIRLPFSDLWKLPLVLPPGGSIVSLVSVWLRAWFGVI